MPDAAGFSSVGSHAVIHGQLGAGDALGLVGGAEFEDLLLRSIVLDPLRSLVPDLDRRLAELPVQLNITYMFQAMIHFTRLWLEHYDSLPTEIAASELGSLCAGPAKLFLKKLLEPASDGKTP